MTTKTDSRTDGQVDRADKQKNRDRYIQNIFSYVKRERKRGHDIKTESIFRK